MGTTLTTSVLVGVNPTKVIQPPTSTTEAQPLEINPTKASQRVEVSSTVEPKSPTPISTKLKTRGKISLLNRRPPTTKSFAGKKGNKKPFSNKGFNKFSFKRFKRESAADIVAPEVMSSKSENLDKLHLSSKKFKPFKVAKHLK